MNRKTLYFTAPRQVELREESLSVLGANDVLVETICSSISAGTEMLVYRGQFPNQADAHDKFSSDLKYPLAYGYACVGIVRETGKDVEKFWRDKLVFGFQPHTTHFITPISNLIPVPEAIPLPAEACCFLPNMETAVNLLQDAAPTLGERVLVLGQGVVGLLVASLLKEFPLEMLVTSDNYTIRKKASLDIGVNDCFDPENTTSPSNLEVESSPQTHATYHLAYTQATDKSKHTSAYAKSFDLTFELSGSPFALNTAIALTAFSGRIVIGSWYGEKQASIDLGGTFHRSRIKLISSQVSTIAPELSGRWDKSRRFEVAWDALKRIQPQKWITHRFSIEDAAQAYHLLDENPQETIQVIFDYKL